MREDQDNKYLNNHISINNIHYIKYNKKSYRIRLKNLNFSTLDTPEYISKLIFMATILLIEDDICLRENTGEILELEGYTVLMAKNGREGIQLALTKNIDLILCDIVMPVVDGYSVLKELSTVPEVRKIPFIFLTAKSGLKEIRTGMNLGADDYIVKPFEEKELLDTIATRLSKYAIFNREESYNSLNNKVEVHNIRDLKQYFLAHGERITLSKNEVLYTESQLARFVYFLKKGLIKTLNIDEYGKELITGIYRKENFFGLYSFNELISYPERALAIESSRLLRLPSNFVQEVFKFNPELTMEWVQDLSEDVIELKNHLLQTAYSSVLRKTVNTLLDFSEKMHFEKEELSKMSRGDLASVAGISKESFIRCLSDLKNNGLINVQGRNIEILNLNALKRIK